MVTRVLSEPTRWSRDDVRHAFEQLSVPDVGDLAGCWQGAFVGRPGLRWLVQVLAAGTPLRRWCGKEIRPSGEIRNLVHRHTRIEKSVAAIAVPGVSILDGRPAVVVDYKHTAKPPVSWARGELRWWSPGSEVLGVLLFPVDEHIIGPFPFQMTRQH